MAYPSAFLQQMREMLGGEYPAFEDALQRPARPALRLNPRRAGVEALLGEAIEGAVPWAPWGRYVRRGFKPGSDPAHFAGGYYMQDASAMAPARVLSPRPGELVLDLCAAPGGKSGQLAAMLAGGGALICNEPEPKRAQVLRGNLERLGVAAAAVVCAPPDRLARLWPQTFDAVLVDAPCSGEGMFRRDPQARDQWSPDRAAGCAKRQREILASAAQMVRPGGRLVYSTCTFNRAENEDNIHWLIEACLDFAPLDFALPGAGRSTGGCLRLWPHKIQGEGHFVALLQRRGEGGPPAATPERPNREALAALDLLLEALPGTWFSPYRAWKLRLQGELLLALPPLLPDLAGLRVLSAGLPLCQVGRGWVRPQHALAMAAETQALDRRQDIDGEQVARFLRGEPLDTAHSGWTLVTWRNLPLGWGKGVQGALKNHLPKGLRL